MNQVFKDFPKTKTAEATINSARVTAKAEYDDRRARNLPSAETEAWRTQRETELQEQAVKMRTDLVAEITAAVKKVAPADANIVWDRSGFSTNRIPVALFTPPDSMSARVSSALAGRDGGPSSGLRGLQVGLVDMNQIFRNYTKTQKAEAKINTAKNAAKQEYDKRAEGYQKEMAKIDTLSGAARDKQIAKVRTLEQQVNGWRVTKEQELQAEAVKMRDGIVKEVSDAITARLTGKSSSLVLDKSGNGTNGVPAVLWSSGVADFTSEITEALNTGRKSGPAVPLTSLSTLKVASIDIERAFRSMPEGSAAGAKGLPGLDATTREPLVARLSAKVSEVAQSAGYNLVIDSSALSSNALPFVVQTSNLPDLTDELIARVK
jgi:Skp family chaperone for outer membrane proteins